MRVNYVSEGGSTQIREVPVGATPQTYKYGVLVGPPDLSELPLTKMKIKELTEALAKAGIGDYNDTRSRRGEILDILNRITKKKDKELLRLVLGIYQKGLF
jgi:hypothetical protein